MWIVLNLLFATVAALLAPVGGGASASIAQSGAGAAAGVQRTSVLQTAGGTGRTLCAPTRPQLMRAVRPTTHRQRLLEHMRTVRRARWAVAAGAAQPREQEPARLFWLAFRAHAPPA